MNEPKNMILFPKCQKCNSLLNIKINNENFSINYECEKDETHKDENIFFKTFERFYMGKKEIFNCSNCNIRLINDIYKCKDCEYVYCGNCLIKHINNLCHKNFLLIEENKCPIHKTGYIEYCNNCKRSICIYCIKSGTHKNHSTESYTNLMLNKNDIMSS